MIDLYNHCDIRVDVPPHVTMDRICIHAHQVLSEVGLVPRVSLNDFFPDRSLKPLIDADHERFHQQLVQDHAKYVADITMAKQQLGNLRIALKPALPPGVYLDEDEQAEIDAFENLPLPRLPHRHFGMTHATSRPAPIPDPEKLAQRRLWFSCGMDLSDFGMMGDRYQPALQHWDVLSPFHTAEDSVDPDTANQLWITTEVCFSGGTRGFERYLQLAVQEVAIRLHRELESRETVGVKWTDGHDERYPMSCWKEVRLFQFTRAGDEFVWDYFPKVYPDRTPLFVPHPDAQLEFELNEYERWLKDTYCR